ncbi:MAG: FAD-dependent oxidoreductase [Eubacterium sp.]|nr:FAD-dependent oxidoreductase [Eubacterium sp.]
MAYEINRELCSGCHRCRVECPVGAIRFKNSKYWIDPDKCISCGHCAEVCHNDVISDPENLPVYEKHSKVEKNCDVLVIGAGASGLAAAAVAAENGKKVLVIEKNKEIGGSAWYAHVFRSHYSKWHKEAGIEDGRDELYKEFMEKTEGHVNGKLVRRILDADEELIDWLIEKHSLGNDYKFGPQFYGGYGPQATYDWEYNHKRIDTTIGPGGTGWYMTNKLLKILKENGGEILYRTWATDILLDDGGRVKGARAEDNGGQIEISCDRIVIATGAMSRNKELTNKFNPVFYSDNPEDEPVHVFACSTCSGDGIIMGEKIGADIDYINARAGMFGPMRHPFGTASITAACNRYGIQVNANGDLFDDGGPGMAVSPLAYEPKRICWKLTNEKSIERAEKESIGRGQDVPGCDMNRFFENWKEELDTEIEWETMYRAETIEELAEKIDVPAEKIRAAFETYNSTCGKAETVFTPDGPKKMPPKEKIEEGPYYAVFMKLFHENALGGLVIDEDASVLRGGRKIPGLYATGDTTRGVMVPGEVGSMYIEGTISALTFALCSGFIAGEECSK